MFNYFYGSEADQFTFYRIPKILFTNIIYKKLSTEAKLLYGLLLDRMGLSIKNKWLDAQNRVFIYFTIEDITEYLNCGKAKAIKLMSELDSKNGIGLIDCKRQGLGKPNIIYVKNCNIMQKSEKQTSAQTPLNRDNLQKYENRTSGGLENEPLEVRKSDPNKTEYNKTDFSNHSHLNHGNEKNKKVIDRDELEKIKEEVKEQLELDILLEKEKKSKTLVLEIYNLIIEVMCEINPTIKIGVDEKSTALVQDRFRQINEEVVCYVILSLKAKETKISNMKNYLLTCLYNAPATFESYFQMRVKSDMMEG